MKKKISFYLCIIGSIIIFGCTLLGCTTKDSIGNAGLSAPFSVVFHSVPFAVGDSVWDEATLIETDQYGRDLYFYKINSTLYGVALDYTAPYYIHALVLCQKEDKDQVYYYENACYLLLQSDQYSAEELAAIKEANDWNKPYVDSNMTSVANTFKQKTVLDQEKCVEAFSETVNTERGYELFFDEVTCRGDTVLCVIREYLCTEQESGSEKYTFGTNYIVLFDKSGEVVTYTSFTGRFDEFPEQLRTFAEKQDSSNTYK